MSTGEEKNPRTNKSLKNPVGLLEFEMRKCFFLFILIILVQSLITSSLVLHAEISMVKVSPPDVEPVVLDPYARLDFKSIDECSGLIKSRKWKNVFWTHNDSGDSARIFAITRQGKIIKPGGKQRYRGIKIGNAENIDWEDIATDNQGNLYIGDVGNNLNNRRDLAVYIVKEPDPSKTSSIKAGLKILFYYPEQKTTFPEKMNFDAEALFFAGKKLYLLTKHRSDRYTKLYRFDSMDPSKKNPLTLIGRFDAQGYVTAADASPDGKRLAVLTYSAVWLLETDNYTDDYFHGKISWLPIHAGQCEGISFDEEKLIISNEGGKLFEVPIKNLVRIQN